MYAHVVKLGCVGDLSKIKGGFTLQFEWDDDSERAKTETSGLEQLFVFVVTRQRHHFTVAQHQTQLQHLDTTTRSSLSVCLSVILLSNAHRDLENGNHATFKIKFVLEAIPTSATHSSVFHRSSVTRLNGQVYVVCWRRSVPHPTVRFPHSHRVTRLTTYCREHAPSLANVVSTTPVRPPGTLCHLTYMTLLTLTHSRNDLKLFCLIVRTDYLLLLYGHPGRFVERRLTNL